MLEYKLDHDGKTYLTLEHRYITEQGENIVRVDPNGIITNG